MTLSDLGYKLRSFAVGERQVEHHHVERPAVPDQGSPFLRCAGQGNLCAVHLPENELQGLREGRVVFYYHHPLHRDTSAPSSTNRLSTTLTEKRLNAHRSNELDLRRILCSTRSVRSLENTYHTGIVLVAEP